MTPTKKHRVWWIKSIGEQDHNEIDISIPGEDRWIKTTVQSVRPDGQDRGYKIDSVEMSKFIHVIEFEAYSHLLSQLKVAVESLKVLGQPFDDGPGIYIARQFEDRQKIARTALANLTEAVPSIKGEENV